MGYRYLYNSDAHYLADIAERGEKNFFELDCTHPRAEDVIGFIKNNY